MTTIPPGNTLPGLGRTGLPIATARPTPEASPSPLQALEDTLDLSGGARDLMATYAALDAPDRAIYLAQLARLLDAGIVGTETLEVRGAPYQSFASTRFADPALANATLRRPIG